MARKSKTFEVGRDAKTGEFVKADKAREKPERYIVERVPKRGHGDTD